MKYWQNWFEIRSSYILGDVFDEENILSVLYELYHIPYFIKHMDLSYFEDYNIDKSIKIRKEIDYNYNIKQLEKLIIPWELFF